MPENIVHADAETPVQLQYAFVHLTNQFNCVAYSPDGKYLASGSSDKTVRVWEASSGKLVRTLEGHANTVWSVAYSPDGKYLASGSDDKTVRVWEASSGKLVRTLEGHANLVMSVAYSPDGKYLASGSDDKTVRVWEASSGKLVRTLEGHADTVWSVAYSPDGKYLASGSYDNTVRVWESSSGKLVRTLEGHANWVMSVAYSPDGKYLASGSDDKTVRVWEASSGKLVRTLEGHADTVWSVAYSPDGKYLASGSYDNTVRVWESSSGKLVRTLEGHANLVMSVAYSPDGKYLASGSDDNTVRVWEASSGKLVRTLEGHANWVMSVAYSPDGKYLASGSDDKTVRVWEASSGKLVRTLKGHASMVRSVAYSPDGKYLASGSYDNTVRVWESSSGKLVRTLEGHANWVMSVAYSPDGKYLASGSDDKTVRVWEASSGKLVRTLEGHANTVWSVAYSPDGKYLASGSDDKTVRVWEASSGKLVRTLEGHANTVWSVAYSPDGKYLASGSYDNTVRVWESSSGKLVRTLEGHANWVRSVAYSPDGKYLASGSDDKTVRVWEASSGKEVQKYESRNLSHTFLNLTFCPVGKLAASFGQTVLGDPDILSGVLEIGAGGREPVAEPFTSYVSAKIVLMGKSEVGKSALALRLMEDRFEEQVSTHGMRLWHLPPERLSLEIAAPPGEQREVVIWDLGGQEEYRLVHQLFLHDTTMALMLLDPTRDSYFDDVHEWNLGLEKRLKGRQASKLLVGAKADQINHDLIDRLRVQELLEKCGMKGFHLTSAKTDIGIAELRSAIAELIDWDDLSKTTRPRLFQTIRNIIEERRKHGEIVLLYTDLANLVRSAEPEDFDFNAVNTVVEQLARQGAITDTRLSTGERALVLQIGYVEIYAGSLVRLAREASRDGGVPVLEMTEAIFRKSFPGIEDKDRLPPLQERTVIECVIELMIEHGLCLKQERLLIFPTLFPETLASAEDKIKDTVSLYYEFSGAIDNIYSSLVAQLAASGKFGRVRLWKDRAEFDSVGQGICGMQRMDRPGGWSHLDLLFGEKVNDETRTLFTAFVNDHLEKEGVTIREVQEMDCRKGDFRFEESLVQQAIAVGNREMICPLCGERTPIVEGAQKVRSDKPSMANEIFALRKAIEAQKQRDIDDAKREMKAASVFVSYSHRDEALRAELTTHLSALRREGLIQTWHDREIRPGDEWKNELDRNLESARIVLLLVSADFIASDYCVDVEVKRALERHAAGEARVIPIILRPVNGWEKMPFGKLQALPELGKPITAWGNKDEAFANVAEGIRKEVLALMRPAPSSEPEVLRTDSPAMPVVEPTPIRILHLSDLHFDADTDPMVRLQPLVSDLRDARGGLGFEQLDYLVISGDLTNRATPEEFERAREFISGLIERFELSAARVVIVPGNHDLSWDVEAYDWHKESKVSSAQLKEGHFIQQGKGYLLRDDAQYPKRFENYARFYHQLTQYPFSLKPEQQFRSLLFDELRVQFLELNSAFEIDEYFPERSGIQQGALANALMKAVSQIEDAKKKNAKGESRIKPEASVFRIAVWHHPVTGNEKIVHDAFVEQLRQADFKLCLHGHVHEEREDLIRSTHPRQLHAVGAGSFGAPMRQRPESTPRLYNLIEVARDHHRVRVHTRALRKDGGAWEPWAVWPKSDNEAERRPFYELYFPF